MARRPRWPRRRPLSAIGILTPSRKLTDTEPNAIATPESLLGNDTAGFAVILKQKVVASIKKELDEIVNISWTSELSFASRAIVFERYDDFDVRVKRGEAMRKLRGHVRSVKRLSGSIRVISLASVASLRSHPRTRA